MLQLGGLRLLIVTAVLYFLGYALYGVREYGQPDGRNLDLTLALAAGAIAIAMPAALIYINYYRPPLPRRT